MLLGVKNKAASGLFQILTGAFACGTTEAL